MSLLLLEIGDHNRDCAMSRSVAKYLFLRLWLFVKKIRSSFKLAISLLKLKGKRAAWK